MEVREKEQILVINNEMTPKILLANEGGIHNDLKSNLTLPENARLRNIPLLSADTFQHLDDLCHVLESQNCASDARLLIFAAAANSEEYREILVAMPPLFRDDIEQLRRLVATWPSCKEMLLKLREMESSHINLLHWLLISQANPILRRYKIRKLPDLCKDLKLSPPSGNPQTVLSVHYKNELHWTKSKRRFAYFGCPLQFLFHLLIMGRMEKNWMGPLRLYDEADAALAQCTVAKFQLPANCWSHSRFGRAPRCVLICEVLPQNKQHLQESNDLILDDTKDLRVRYLLIFTENNSSVECLPSTSFGIGSASSVESKVNTNPLNNSIFKSRFTGSIPKQRLRGSWASRWIFRLVGFVMGRVVQVVRTRRRTF